MGGCLPFQLESRSSIRSNFIVSPRYWDCAGNPSRSSLQYQQLVVSLPDILSLTEIIRSLPGTVNR